jgi:pimeloyl-ACP methyl ester carboxylesterase
MADDRPTVSSLRLGRLDSAAIETVGVPAPLAASMKMVFSWLEVRLASPLTSIRTGDIETYYEEQGNGPPVVFVHAATLDHGSWRPQLDALKDHYRVLAYDLRGHGSTADSSSRRYTVDVLAQDLQWFILAKRLERPVVCGISMGGMTALTFASRHPGALSALVLAGTPSPDLLSLKERLQRVVMPRMVVPVAHLMGYARLKRQIVKMQAKAHGDAAMGSFTEADLPDMKTRDFIKAIQCMASFHHVSVDPSKIEVPTCLMVGENEPPFILAHAKRLQAQIRGSAISVIPEAGHASNMDQPAFFSEALGRFLGGLDAR